MINGQDKVKEFLAASFKNAKLEKDFKSTSDKQLD